jgi:hypothetical protein
MNDGFVPEMDYQALNEAEEGKKGFDLQSAVDQAL